MATGSVRQDRHGWYFVLDLPPVTGEQDGGGRRRQVKKRGFESEADARAGLEARIGQLDEAASAPEEVLTVARFLEEMWLPRIKPSLKVSTWSGYRDKIRLHVIPALGAKALNGITALQLTDFYQSLLLPGANQRSPSKGLSAKSVKSIHGALHQAFGMAVAWRRLEFNPCEGALVPKGPKPRVNVLAWEQVPAFVALFDGEHIQPAVEFALYTGLRRGELLGLRWCDVDWASQRILVEHTRLVTDGEVYNDVPKTSRGHRVVPLSERPLEILRTISVMDAHRLPLDGSFYVFTDEAGNPYRPDQFGQRFAGRVGSQRWRGQHIRLHDLRHTFATLSLTRFGVPIGALSKILGHASVAFTMDVYAHWMPDDLDVAMGGWSDSIRLASGRDAPSLLAAPSGWAAVTDEDLVRALSEARSVREILQRLGLSVATKNYDRLRVEALRLGLDLPRRSRREVGENGS